MTMVQVGNFCFECVTLYTHFSLSSILNIHVVTGCSENGNTKEWEQ